MLCFRVTEAEMMEGKVNACARGGTGGLTNASAPELVPHNKHGSLFPSYRNSTTGCVSLAGTGSARRPAGSGRRLRANHCIARVYMTSLHLC